MADSGEQHELVELVPATESQEDGATDRDIVDNNEPEVEEGYVSDGGRAGDQREVNIEADHDDEPPRELPTAPTERIVADYAGSERPERPPHINLCQAVKDDKEEDVKEWLKSNNKKRVRFHDKHGFAPVHYAAKFNRLEILRTLHKTGNADVTAKTVSEEYTPLHLAARIIIPPRTTQESAEDNNDESDDSRVEGHTEADGGSGPTRQISSEKSTMEYLLKNCKGVDVNAKNSYDLTPLHLACQARNLEGVKILLEDSKINVSIQDCSGDTPLHEACLHGEDQIVELLLNKMKPRGTDSKIKLWLIKNHLGLTPFHLACREGHVNIAKQLLSSAEKPSRLVAEVDTEGATALHLACQKDQPEIIEFLLENQADISTRKNDGMTPAHVAAQYGCQNVVWSLLNKGCNVNVKDKYNQTPMHFATEYGKKDMMELLMDNGADPEAKDIDDYTPLLTAAEFGQKEAFECLIDKGVDITAQNKEKKSALYLAAQSNHPQIVQIILENENGQTLLLATDTNLNTPLHAAAEKGHVESLEIILGRCDDKFRIDEKNISRKTAMHLAAENGHTDVVKMLAEKCTELQIDMLRSMDEDGNTPLHLACTHGYEEVALYLIRNQADIIGARNEILWTPLDCAASKGHARVIERLVNFKANIDPKDKQKTTPLHLAAKEGHVTAVETLIKHGATVSSRDYHGFNALDWAIENGHSDVAEVIINSQKWKFALKNHITMQDGRETTPFRKLIQRMPDVAELVLRKCTVSNAKDRNIQPDSEDYTVTFNYEFIEDKDLTQTWKEDIESNTLKDSGETTETRSTWQRLKEKSLRFWGHSELAHPLRIMVKSKRTDLLKHPLMYNLIEHKWNKFGRIIFYLMLVFHILLVIFLTAFALRLLNPFSPTCEAVSSGLFDRDQVPLDISQLEASNAAMVMDYLTSENITIVNGTASLDGRFLCFGNIPTAVRDTINSVVPIEPVCGRCGLSTHDTNFIKAAAVFIILFSVVRLVLEIVRFIRQLHNFFADFDTWVEVPLFIFAIIFAAVFNRECLCPRDWQWQVGIAAVFLVWVDLILYMRRMRVLDTGIYVLMFEAIFKTFLRVIILTILLVVTFALTFYMAFDQFIPRFSRSPFASPFTSIWKTMTMATGELGYDDIFRQFTSEPVSDGPDIPFPAISYIMWVIFLILMPILFTNLLVGLAVDDIKGILDAAALTRLALRVDLVLGIEDYFWFLPWIRHHMNEKRLKIKPYKGHVKRFFSPLMGLLRGENYASAEHIANVLNPVKSPSEQQTQALMHEMTKMQQQTQQEMAKMQEALQTLSRVVHDAIQQNSGNGAHPEPTADHGEDEDDGLAGVVQDDGFI